VRHGGSRGRNPRDKKTFKIFYGNVKVILTSECQLHRISWIFSKLFFVLPCASNFFFPVGLFFLEILKLIKDRSGRQGTYSTSTRTCSFAVATTSTTPQYVDLAKGFDEGRMNSSGLQWRRHTAQTVKCGGKIPKTGVANSNCSEGQMRTYKISRKPHYDADATMAVPEPW